MFVRIGSPRFVWHPGCAVEVLPEVIGITPEGHGREKEDTMLDKIRKLPDSLQGLVVAGALGLSVLVVVLIIKLLA
jgi:hypothetical protein